MADEELDVKKPEDPSPEETEVEAEEVETEDADVKEEDSGEETPEQSEESEAGAETPEEEVDLKAQLEKAETEKENLKKALQEARSKPKTSLTQSVAASPADESLTIDPNAYVRNLVLQAEEEAKSILYQEFPELHPDNDPDNSYYNEFSKDFAIAARMKGVTPVSKDNFLQIGRLVMGLKTGRIQSEEKKQASADAHKESAKGNAASIGGTSVASKPEKQEPVTDADRRAAKAAGMELKTYMKNKNVYDDGIPI